MDIILFLAALIPFYLIGAFPTGVLLAKSQGVDLSKVGSGNVGATNVARALGKKAGILTLVIDVTKGVIAALAAGLVTDEPGFIGAASVACVLGHCLSIPGILRGGKGVATALGCLMVLSPISAATSVTVFAGVFGAFRFVSLASIAAALSAPLIPLVSGENSSKVLSIAIMALILTSRHWQNLGRLVNGQEPKFGAKTP
jgi:glycerol-3-phosphate acyltransferase PlsY